MIPETRFSSFENTAVWYARRLHKQTLIQVFFSVLIVDIAKFLFQVSSIENSQDYKADLMISGSGLLIKFKEKGKSDIDLSYDSYTGLLTSRTGGDNVIKVNVNDDHIDF